MSNNKCLRRVQEFLGLERNTVIMTLGRAVRNFGARLWQEYVPKVLETLGASAPMIGTFGTINRGFSTLYAYLGGAISDRLGRGRAMVFSALIALVGYAIYLVAPTWWALIPGSILLSASTHFDFMGSMAMFGETVSGKRRAASMATMGLLTLPLSLAAPPIGGAIFGRLGFAVGFRVGVAITLALTVVVIIAQRRLYRLPPPASSRFAVNMRESWRAMPAALKSMLAANSLIGLGSGMFMLFVVLYAMNVTGVTAIQFGILTSVTTGASALLSIPVGKLADRRGGLGRAPFVAISFGVVAVVPLLLIAAPSFAWLVPVFALRGARDSFDTVRKAMIIDLAGRGEHGRVIGLYFFVIGVVGFPAAFIAGWLWQVRPELPFVVGSVICSAGFLLLLIVSRRLRRA